MWLFTLIYQTKKANRVNPSCVPPHRWSKDLLSALVSGIFYREIKKPDIEASKVEAVVEDLEGKTNYEDPQRIINNMMLITIRRPFSDYREKAPRGRNTTSRKDSVK